ncbi:hypothetical protein EDB81DRAFT_639508 [Dactylonectria macrodidyma]|uniref:SH3 domain-containing protein n=1 Tax=Dactylonectria macrodidyma TaxID=307937 RepID=A0A9P9JFR4_9HYPO|nr:hypothetical protein EDB81DRAFT_639508 [Dactylonectria macrodidyma]
MDHPRPTKRSKLSARRLALSLLVGSPALVAAENCISLKGSTSCPAFASASISINSSSSDFPFLLYVSDRESFDTQIAAYVKTTYVESKYVDVFGCGNIDLTNSSDMYARFTTTVLCNAIVQNSISVCGLSDDQSRPLCAETCAEFAQSEVYVTSDDSLCSNPRADLLGLIRSDFTICALPEGALDSSTCVTGMENESNNCGYGNSTVGLCSYCAQGGINSTDTCCYNANAEDRCVGVELPSLTATVTFTAPTASSTSDSGSSSGGGSNSDNDSDSDSDNKDNDNGLGGGAIAGIVIGVLAGIALLAVALFFCIRRRKARPVSPKGSIFNQPSPARKGPVMAQAAPAVPGAPQGYEVLPGGRIARMSALEGHSGNSPSHHRDDSSNTGGVGYIPSRRRGHNTSSSSSFGESPESDNRAGIIRAKIPNPRRNGSLSSGSVLGSSVPQSPTSAGGFSSPPGMTSQQSEQLPFFKDYYSSDDIHPNDRVAVLWAYQPRAADEFSLGRGDILKVVGIWDDGWATGVILNERAEDWEARRAAQRDSGVSNTSGRRESSPIGDGEIKAFPLVCVCLPEHWRKTIEGDGSTESGSNGFNPHS